MAKLVKKSGNPIGSKLKEIQAQIDSIKVERQNLAKATGNIKGDVGTVKELEAMDAQIDKLKAQLRELKGSGGGSIKNTGDTSDYSQGRLNMAARIKVKKK
tara:strand:- start:76 stop:378 length:303 start_codon:yes stop_codon:yes gene_type:complete